MGYHRALDALRYEVRSGVNKSNPGRLVGTAVDPQKADRLAAAPRS